MSFASLAIQQFVDPATGRPVSSGSLYIGIPDLDPEIPANQKSIRLRQENGVEVATSQPVSLGGGGVPLYNGSPVQVIVDGNYSLKVLDRNGAQVYYVPSGASLTTLGSVTNRKQLYTAVGGETVVNLTGGFAYTPGSSDLVVFIDGRRQYLEAGAYAETSTTSVTFSEPLFAGQEVLFSTNEIDASISTLEGSATPQVGKAALWEGMPVYDIRLFGAIPGGAFDCKPAIDLAILAAYNAGGGTVLIPPGIWGLLSLDAPYYLLKLKSKVSVKGVGPSSILKAGAGLRTAATGIAILYNHDEYIQDCTIEDLTIDYNGQNNLNQAAWSGNADVNRTGGNIASGCMIRNVHFKNSSGHHFVWFGLTVEDSRNDNNSVHGCSFEECGTSIVGNDVSDHSSIFMGCTNGSVEGNTFKNLNQDLVGTAIELHSDNTTATGNRAEKYNHGLNLGGDSNTVKGVAITGNTFKSVCNGIVLWTFDPFTIEDLTITGNTIDLFDTEGTIRPPGSGIRYTSTDTSTALSKDWNISGNVITMAGTPVAFTYPNTGIELGHVEGLDIIGNTISRMRGEGIRVAPQVTTKQIKTVRIANNTIRTCGFTSAAGRKVGISMLSNAATGLTENMTVENNDIIAGTIGGSAAMQYGIQLNGGGQFENLRIKNNNIVGATTQDILTPTNQTGTLKPIIIHESGLAGHPFDLGIRCTFGSKWHDKTTGYDYEFVNSLGTPGGVDGWNSRFNSTGSPQTTAPHSTRAHKRGDRAMISLPAVGSPKAWLCTLSGTPGTWVSEGNL